MSNCIPSKYFKCTMCGLVSTDKPCTICDSCLQNMIDADAFEHGYMTNQCDLSNAQHCACDPCQFDKDVADSDQYIEDTSHALTMHESYRGTGLSYLLT